MYPLTVSMCLMGRNVLWFVYCTLGICDDNAFPVLVWVNRGCFLNELFVYCTSSICKSNYKEFFFIRPKKFEVNTRKPRTFLTKPFASEIRGLRRRGRISLRNRAADISPKVKGKFRAPTATRSLDRWKSLDVITTADIRKPGWRTSPRSVTTWRINNLLFFFAGSRAPKSR